MSLAVISTNVIVGIVQEIRAKRTLDRIALLTRPTATVVRAGATSEVAPEELVLGDLVVGQAGDQIVLDGRLVDGDVGVDESQLTGECDVVRKRPGDEVFSGSFATTGAGRYVAENVAAGSFANQITAGARSFRRVITPLQAEVNLVIRVVLGIVLYLEVLLVVRGLVQRSALGDVVADATLLAGLVPNGLFVSIAVAYALGAIRILRFGALVQQSNAIETLSHVDVLCLDKTGTLTANRLAVEAVSGLGGATEDEVIAALSALAASATVRNKTTQAIAARWPREGRPQAAEVPFSSARKWSAVAFAHADTALPGIIALGAPTFLRPSLAVGADGEPAAGRSWSARVRRLDRARPAGAARGHVRRRGGRCPPHEDEAEATLPAGMRALGLVAMADELRGGGGGDARVVRRGRRRRQDHLGRRPGHRRRARAPGGPRRRRVDLGPRARRARRRGARQGRRGRRRSSAGSRRRRRSGWSTRSRRAATTWR